MNLHKFIPCAYALALFSLCALADEKPNVVFIITDDQGYGDLGCHGNPVIQTPHMDQLHSESSVLDDYHVAPTCSPTRAALLTGHWTNRTGVWHTIMGRSMLRSNEVTIAQILKDNGYTTGMFGKWHLGDNYPYRPHDRGFDLAYYHGGGGVGQTPDYWNNSYFDGNYFRNGKSEPAKGFCTYDGGHRVPFFMHWPKGGIRCSKGLAFPFTEAVLRIDGKEVSRKPVAEEDISITFTAELNKGSIKLAPVFLTEKGGEIGSYYAVIRKK